MSGTGRRGNTGGRGRGHGRGGGEQGRGGGGQGRGGGGQGRGGGGQGRGGCGQGGQARGGGGQGRQQQGQYGNERRDAPFVPAPAPATSAWGPAKPALARSTDSSPFAPASVPTTSAWGLSKPALAESSVPSDTFGRSSGQTQSRRGPGEAIAVTVPTTSAWGAMRAALPDSSNRSSFQFMEKKPQHDQTTQSQQQRQPQSSTFTGSNDQREGRVGRGAIREGRVIKEIIKTRPDNLQTKRGTDGRTVTLTTNYYKILKAPKWQIYQYRVDFSPNIEHRRFQNKLIREQKPNLGEYLFDGTMLFLIIKLRAETTEFMTKDREDNPIQITVKFVGLLSMTTASSIQLLNLVLRRSMGALNLKLLARNYFDDVAKVDIPHYRLQIWPGYQTSIRQHEVDILLCVDLTSKVMRTETVLNILRNCYRDGQNRHGADWKTAFEEQVIGMTVFTAHNNRTYRIDDIDYEQSPSSTFLTKAGDKTFIEYYMEKYNLRIVDQHQPLLIQRPSDRDLRAGKTALIALIPELCRPTGLTKDMRKDYRLMADVGVYTRLSPGPRIAKLKAFNERLQSAKDSVKNLEGWNLKLDSNLVELTGRVLQPETILFKNKRAVTNKDADWSREFRNIEMYRTVHLKRWNVIVPKQCEKEWTDFFGILKQAAFSIGYGIVEPTIGTVDDKIESYKKALVDAGHCEPQLIMCVLKNQDAVRYGLIKKKCCVERAVPTQVIVQNTIRPKGGKPLSSLLSIATKVVIQINSKLGGVPWMLDLCLTNVMTIGFDVCHDTKDGKKSYGAMVASMDLNLNRKFYSVVSAHENGEELSNEFALNIIKALRQYSEGHGTLPSHILIYRDGVGEGDTGYVFAHEITNIRAKLDVAYAGATYKMSFIVVSKRINTRFFNKGENPSPGTIVDDVVTLPERYDFFLVSQSVRAGTVSPTNYNVLYNNTGLSPNHLQVLTYKMTHLYYNWSGTLRVPAVCQYAHKLAYLVGNFIHQSPSNLLEKQLYFL